MSLQTDLLKQHEALKECLATLRCAAGLVPKKAARSFSVKPIKRKTSPRIQILLSVVVICHSMPNNDWASQPA